MTNHPEKAAISFSQSSTNSLAGVERHLRRALRATPAGGDEGDGVAAAGGARGGRGAPVQPLPGRGAPVHEQVVNQFNII